MLEVDALSAFYGQSQILRGVSFTVRQGEVIGLLGRNGSGRSTTLKAVMGEVQAKGRVSFLGRDILRLPSHVLARRGISLVPEERDVFPDLSVAENLEIGQAPWAEKQNWTIADSYSFFPALAARKDAPAGALSGGEQQMLTMCRSLLNQPRLMMIDEPTEGLAPKIVAQIRELILEIRRRGISIILVEQKLAIALQTCDRVLLLGEGRVQYEGVPGDFMNDRAIQKRWLEV